MIQVVNGYICYSGCDLAKAKHGENPRQKRLVFDVAFVQRHALGHGETEACAEIVDDGHGPSGIAKGEHRVAADVPGAAGDKDGNFRNHPAPVSTNLAPRERIIAAAHGFAGFPGCSRQTIGVR